MLPWLATAAGLALAPPLNLDKLHRGSVVVVRDWLPAELLRDLRADATSLLEAGAFTSSGLSNTAKGGRDGQGFGDQDRSVCAVTPDLEGNRAARAEFAALLEDVRQALIGAGWPVVCAEQYYSVSGTGATLPRHMDERHEELKGARGWVSSYRRSTSWLCYLCEPGWDEEGEAGAGGALRAFVREGAAGSSACGAHEQNLQVGWLEEGAQHTPVYLDCFVPVESSAFDPEAEVPTPRWLARGTLHGGRRA